MVNTSPIITLDDIQQRIFMIRGQKVMLDSDLAELYGVETRALIQAVKRNSDRFPQDFMFQLKKQEVEILKSQFVISSWGGRRSIPHAFTEHGILMLSSVLRSERAVQVNIDIMRIFVKLRGLLASNKELSKRLDEMETNYDEQFSIVFEAIRELMEPPAQSPKNPIGFQLTSDKK